MRTTINLPDELVSQAKKAAAESGRTFTAVVEDALREALSRRAPRQQRRPVRLPTFGGTGVLPGVDLDDSAALLDLMDSRSAPDRR
jgi:Bacterial antitoxin of type II TA system, VapB